MFQIKNLSFSFGDKPLYKNVNITIGKNQKIGFVGPNGSGKSTFLKMLLGKEDGYAGMIIRHGKTEYVPQEIKYDPEMEKAKSVKTYVDPENNYHDYELHKYLSGLELKINLITKPQKLSGGQKTKLALARALLAKPDTLLLDEPTNFMDTPGKKWVMNFLGSYQGCVVVVSHDLELMNQAIDKVLAINPSLQSIEEYKGTYSDFVRLKKQKEVIQKKQFTVKQKQIKRMEEALSKMTRLTSKKGVRQKVRQKKRIEKAKLELPELPQEVAKIRLQLPEPARVGEIPIQAKNISKSFEDLLVLRDVNFTITRGETITLIGVNGTGKSTFIKILMDIQKADGGLINKSPQLKVGYYSQEFEVFDFSDTLIGTFCDETSKSEDFARSFLGRFMFSDEKVFQKIGTLSGGEKTRLAIAILTATDNNLLILDEPTTYLDAMSQRIILETLKEYKGTMILVSHTPEFIMEINPDKAFLFPEEKMVYWSGELLERIAEF